MLTVRVLGDIEVERDATRVEIGGSQPKTLLARLVASAGSIVAEDSLVVALWGDDPPASARNSLQSKISRLRRALDADVVRAGGSGYRLVTEAADIDVERFETLLAEARSISDHSRRFETLGSALDLWRGPAFAGIEAEAVRAAAVRLDELRLTAAEERFDAALACGLSDEVADQLRRLAAEHPERERLCRQLMLCLHRGGRSAEALDVGRSFRARLAEETGLDPSAAFADLESSIAANDPRLDAEPRAGSVPARVPAPPTSLVGREQDVTDVMALLDRERIVTLRGVGGVGKTRLAFEVARRLGEQHEVWVAELAQVGAKSAVEVAVARSLGLRERGGPIRDQLCDRLSGGRTLLVLDNCEHLLDPVADLVAHLVRQLPDLVVLATSREVLNVRGEHVWHVNPLDVADESSASVALFCERARAVCPDLVVDAHLHEIVRRLDGLPLAIELAAARADRMTLSEIAERLSQPMRFLVGGRRDVDERHRTLRDVVDWSYQMLDADVQAVFERMSVFAGGCTLEAIAAVAAGPDVDAWDVERALDRLVDTSLLVARMTEAGTRYAMLDTIAAFALERLHERGEHDTTVKRHARWAIGFLRAALAGVYTREDAVWQLRIEQEVPNLIGACRRLMDGGDTDAVVQFWAELGWFSGDTFGVLFEESLVRRADPVVRASRHPARGDALAGLSSAWWGIGDLEAARECGRLGAEEGSAIAIANESVAALFQGDLGACETLALRAVELLDEDHFKAEWTLVAALATCYSGRPEEALSMVDACRAWCEASESLQVRAFLPYYRGEVLMHLEELDVEAVDTEFSEAIRLARAARRSLWEAVALTSLASHVARTGDPRRAVALFREAIEALRPVHPTQFWTAMRNLSELLFRLDEVEDAAYIRSAAASATGASSMFGAEADRDRFVSGTLEQRLGTTRYRDICAAGRGASRAEVTDRALQVLGRLERDRWGEGGLRTIVFTDVVDSTPLTADRGDVAARGILRECEDLTRVVLTAHGGEEIKTLGDGVLATFTQPSAALTFAAALQERVCEQRAVPVGMRVGVHAGEILADAGDVHGLAVNIASRVADRASEGEILLTDTVRQLVAGTDFVCEEIGSRELKGVPEPVRLYVLRR